MRNNIRWRLLLMSLLACFVSAPSDADPLRVIYPQAQADVDEAYFVKVLALALQKSGSTYSLSEWKGRVRKERAFQELKRGAYVDVVWAVTNKVRERDWLPVRIALDKGLSGYRLLLINEKDMGKFINIQPAQLRELVAGQGLDWADTAILRANGFAVRTGSDFEGLVQMLVAKRFDYFPRSIRQIWEEAGRVSASGVVVEPTIFLHYPSAVYFFVARPNKALASTLERGLKIAIADGSFDKLFDHYGGASLKRAQLEKRIVFELSNPHYSLSTP